MSIDLSTYNTVAERIAAFRERYPDGSLQPVDPAKPFTVEAIGEKTFLTYTAAAYRTPDDPRPGIGVAWEPFPGRTNYTRDSELQNVETSAWGRAIVAALAADTRKGIASREEVENRQADRDSDWEAATPANAGQAKVFDEFMAEIAKAPSRAAIAEIGSRVHMAKVKREITQSQYFSLDVKAGARNAELDQEAAAAPEGAP